MFSISELLGWMSNNEAVFSALAALLALIGAGFYILKYLHGTFSSKSLRASADSKRITLQDLSAPSPFPIQFASVDGLRIAFNIMGKGDETLILTPGIVSNLHVASHLPAIRNTMDALAQFSRLINFDKRGQGLSDTILEVAQLDARTRDIDAVAEASDSKEFFLMGISEGGPMSVRYCAENPGKVKGLILFGTTARFLQAEDYPIGIPEKVIDALGNNWGNGRTRGIFFPGIEREAMTDDVYKGLERLLASRDSMRQLVDYMKTLDVRDILSKVTCPCLVIHFSGDMAVPARMGRALAEGLPNCTFLEVAGIDHGDLARAPSAIEAIREFIDENS